MKGCQHRACRNPHWRNVYVIEVGTQALHIMYYDTCRRCGAWLPLGPSDEAPVAVEVRAAELAADWRENIEALHPWEADGWRGCDPDDATDDVERASRSVGYLAHAIAHHDVELAVELLEEELAGEPGGRSAP